MNRLFFSKIRLAKTLFLSGFLLSTVSILKAQDPIFVRLFVHVIEDDNGNGGVTPAQVEETVSMLNDAFNPNDIYFIRDCASYDIENTDYYENGMHRKCEITDEYSPDVAPYNSGMNIYITGDFAAPGGAAESIRSNAFVIGGFANSDMIPYSRSSVVAHEMGHCLGLLHTHYATGSASGYEIDCGVDMSDPSACAELVNGDVDNRNNCGDRTFDTPADPNLQNKVALAPLCQYIGMEQDAAGDYYTPDVGNIMSYSRLSCRDHFSSEQVKDMKGFLDIDPLLSATVIDEETLLEISFDFSGASCPGSQFTVTYDVCLIGEQIGNVDVDLSVSSTVDVSFGGDFVNDMASTSLSSGCNTVILEVTNNTVPLGQVFPIQLTTSSDPTLFSNIEACGLLEITSGTIPSTFDYEYGGPCEIQFTSDFSGGTHLWDFGDGNTSNEENPLHQYISSLPQFVVTHSVTTACGMTTTTEVVFLACSQFFDCSCDPFQDFMFGLPTSTTRLSQYQNVPSQISGCVAIAGHFIIDQPLTFNLAEVFMQPGAVIEIEENADPNITNGLVVRESTLKGCGDEMWQGVIVNSNTEFISEQDSRIEDAMYAVSARENALVGILSTTFDRNRVGIFSENNFQLNALADVTFDCSSALVSPLEGLFGEAGIKVKDLDLLSVGVLGLPPVVFQNIRNGILAENTNIMVTSGNFNNIAFGDYPTAGYGIKADGSGELFKQEGNCDILNYSTTFDHCDVGIFLEGMDAEVIANNMTNVIRGVEISESQNENIIVCGNSIACSYRGINLFQNAPAAQVKVDHNIVNVTSQSIFGSTVFGDPFADAINITESGMAQPDGMVEMNNVSTTDAGAGIRMHLANGYVVVDNNVDASSTGIFAFYSGISLNNCRNTTLGCNLVDGDGSSGIGGDYGPKGIRVMGSLNSRLGCNTIQDTHLGLHFDVDCSDTEVMGSSFNNHFYPLHYGELGLTGPQPNNGGSFTNGNRWNSLGQSGFGARHMNSNDPNYINQSQYLVPTIAAPQGPEAFSSISSAWFDLPNPFKGETLCGVCLRTPPHAPFLKQLDIDIAEGTVDPGVHTLPMKWMMERNLYRKLKNDPSLIEEGSTVETFYNANASTPLGLLTDVEFAVGDLFELDSNEIVQLEDHYSQINSRMEAVVDIDSSMAVTLPHELSALQAQRDSILQEIGSLSASNRTLVESILTDRGNQADVVIAQNNGVATTAIYQANEKTVNDVYLRTLVKGLPIQGNDLTALDGIASQCIYEGGMAVIAARSLLDGFSETAYTHEATCGQSGTAELISPPTGAIGESVGMKLFPNPANDKVTVQFAERLNNNSTLVLVNAFGQLVGNFQLGEGMSQFTFQLNDATPGIYMVKLLEDGNETGAMKLTVTR